MPANAEPGAPMTEVDPIHRRRRPVRLAIAAIAISLAVLPALAQTRAPVTARAEDPALAAARAAFESLGEAERRGLQDALVWTGDQVGGTDGAFGRQTYEGLMAYQRRLGAAPTGLLDAKARASLLAEGQTLRQAAGFTMIDDQKTGVRIGIPTRLLPKRGTNPSGGSRWQSPDGTITVDTRSVPDGDATLQSLYDRNLANQGPGRKVTYKVLRPDFFVVSGETSGGRFYTRYAVVPDGLKGVSIGYDKSLGKGAEKLVIAVANSFAPAGAVYAPAIAVPEPAPPANPALLGTGLVTAPRRIATTAKAEGCTSLHARGRPARVVARGADGLVFLEPAEPLDPSPLPTSAAPADDPLAVLALSSGATEGPPILVVAPGKVGGAVLTAPVQPPADGAVILGRDGGLVGLVTADDRARPAIAGTVPASRYRVVSADRLADGGEPKAAPGDIAAPNAAALVAAVRAAIVPITCGP
jgi:hypothetical protein